VRSAYLHAHERKTHTYTRTHERACAHSLSISLSLSLSLTHTHTHTHRHVVYRSWSVVVAVASCCPAVGSRPTVRRRVGWFTSRTLRYVAAVSYPSYPSAVVFFLSSYHIQEDYPISVGIINDNDNNTIVNSKYLLLLLLSCIYYICHRYMCR
jgi:hypothetical protein